MAKWKRRGESMDINITGRNVDLNDSIKDYIRKRLSKIDRLYRRIYKCEVILEEEKIRKNVEVVLYLKSNRIVARGSSTDIYASIDSASTSITKQVRRLNDKVQSRRRKSVFNRIMNPFRGTEETVFPEQKSEIVKTNAFADKPMLPEEAKLELELMGWNFVMFKNADTGEANVLYKRNDGNCGLIEPKF